MTKLVNNGPEEHLDLVEKMQKGLKVRRSGVYDIGGGVRKEGNTNNDEKKDGFVTVIFTMMMPVNESTCNKSITILTTLI